jgi:hypothetical protein
LRFDFISKSSLCLTGLVVRRNASSCFTRCPSHGTSKAKDNSAQEKTVAPRAHLQPSLPEEAFSVPGLSCLNVLLSVLKSPRSVLDLPDRNPHKCTKRGSPGGRNSSSRLAWVRSPLKKQG